MNPSNFKSIVLEPAQSASASGDVFATVDTKGYDYMSLELLSGTHAAAETALEILRLGESDTVPTDVTTDTTIIPALSCAAAVGATASNILPPGSSTKQNIYRFNVNCTGRKRYIALDYTPVQQVAGSILMVAHLFRNNSGDDPLLTAATTADGFRFVADV